MGCPDENERMMFRWLVVFCGGFTLSEAARRVAGGICRRKR